MGLDKEAALKKIQESESPEFEVYTAEEQKTFLENYEDSVIAPKVSEIHNQYDKDLLEITGKKRPGNVKTYTFMKETYGEMAAQGAKAKEYEDEIKGLKEKIKDNSGDEQLKKDLAKVQLQYKTDKETWGKEKEDLLTSHERSRLGNEMDRALMGIKFKDGITDQMRNIIVESVKNELLETAKWIDGQMVFLDKEGQTLRNKENALNAFTPSEMLRLKLKDILDEGRKMPGTGVTPKVETNADGKKSVNYIPSDWVKTKDDLGKDLAEKGFVRDTEEYLLALDKYFDSLPY